MPLFDVECNRCGAVVEHYFHRQGQPTAPCDHCGSPDTHKLVGSFNVVFTGAITARYSDRGSEGAHMDGHWAWGSKDPITGKSTPEFISTWDQQRDFCKRNNVVNPKEMPRNYEVAENGRQVLNTRGMPGTEL